MRFGSVRLVESSAIAALAGCNALLGIDRNYQVADDASWADSPDDTAGDAAGDADGGDANTSDGGAFTCRVPKAPLGTACTTSGTCANAILVPGVQPVLYPVGNATDATYYYWGWGTDYNNHGNGEIARVAKSGGNVDVLANNVYAPGAVAVDTSNVYWSSGTSPPGIYRMTKPPCTSSCGPEPIYMETNPGAPGFSEILVVGERALLAISDMRILQLTFDGVTWSPQATWPSQAGACLTFDGLFGYAGAVTSSNLEQLDLDAHSEATWLSFVSDSSIPGARHMATDCTSLFVQHATGNIEWYSASAQLEGSIAFSGNPYAIRVDDTFIYVAIPDVGGVQRFPRKSGALPTNIAPGNVWGLVVEDDAIYYGDHGDGSIHRITK